MVGREGLCIASRLLMRVLRLYRPTSSLSHHVATSPISLLSFNALLISLSALALSSLSVMFITLVSVALYTLLAFEDPSQF